jgi:hypothetical protein
MDLRGEENFPKVTEGELERRGRKVHLKSYEKD